MSKFLCNLGIKTDFLSPDDGEKRKKERRKKKKQDYIKNKLVHYKKYYKQNQNTNNKLEKIGIIRQRANILNINFF